MFENIFGIHEQALMLHGQRLGVLAANLANADTPGYKARDIDFSAVLAHTQGETQLPLQVTHAAHLTFNDGELPAGDLKYSPARSPVCGVGDDHRAGRALPRRFG